MVITDNWEAAVGLWAVCFPFMFLIYEHTMTLKRQISLYVRKGYKEKSKSEGL